MLIFFLDKILFLESNTIYTRWNFYLCEKF